LPKKNDIKIQEFVSKNDEPCGSTIGPILSTATGIRTVDCGNPQLSMHSIREMTSTTDVTNAIQLFTAFFEQFSELNTKLVID